MSLSSHPKAYGTAAVAVAFVAGVCVTLGFKDFYPDLERRYQQSKRRTARNNKTSSHRGSLASEAETARRRSSFFWGPVELEDHDDSQKDADSHLFLPPTAGPVVGIEGCIGNTPLVEIKSLSDATGRTILAKAEFLNGAGNSPKDRVALSMIQAGEASGLLVPGRGDTIYEGTVGSTGISLAALARAKGYKAHICMPDDVAREKSDLLHHLGATVERVRVAPITSPDHFVNLARRRARDHTADRRLESNGFFADQFESGANWLAHFNTTGPEIYYQTGGEISAFVAGAGTGGTISGVTKYLKEEAKMADLKIVLADPQGSGLYNKVKYGVMYSATEKEGTRRRHQVDTIVEGIGINRITNNFNAGRDYITDAVKVSDEQACRMARWLVEHDGIFAGSSSAVNCVAAVAAAMKLPEGSRVVTILCDQGTRHLSKFWKKVGEMGLEEQEEPDDLLGFLGLVPAAK